jgi:hypothetical protein
MVPLIQVANATILRMGMKQTLNIECKEMLDEIKGARTK